MWRRLKRLTSWLLRPLRARRKAIHGHFPPQTDTEWVSRYIDTDGPEPVIRDENVLVWTVVLEYFRKGCRWDAVREAMSLHRVQTRAVEAFLRLNPTKYRPYFRRSLERGTASQSTLIQLSSAPRIS